MKTITLKHFENGIKQFTISEFITHVQRLFDENEESDTHLTRPANENEAREYLSRYCDNWIINTH